MTVIIDGMTQSTTTLPHFVNRPSWLDKMDYDVHVIGSIVETLGVHLEFSYKNIGDNSNVLIDTINDCIERMHTHRRSRGEPFPEVLYLQLDNVSSNKSKVLVTYLSWLVETGVFKKIKVNYLLVGHTHEIIDQVFSRYSVLLRTTQCLTLGELMNAGKVCYTPSPTVAHITSVTDWAEWLQRSKCVLNAIEAISFNHAFRIKRNDRQNSPTLGKVVVHSKRLGYRVVGAPKEWRPRNGVQQLLCLPEGHAKPQNLKELDVLDMVALQKIFTGFERNIGDAAFSGDLRAYWQDQLELQDAILEGSVVPPDWDFQPLKSSFLLEGTRQTQAVLSSLMPRLISFRHIVSKIVYYSFFHLNRFFGGGFLRNTCFAWPRSRDQRAATTSASSYNS
jgi:hypothetical protein